MMKRNLLVALCSCLVLAAAPLIGCGGTDDPTLNQNQNTVGDGDNDGDGEPGDNDGDGEPGDPDTDGEPGDPDTDGEPDTDGDPDGDGDDESCSIDESFFGQIDVDRQWGGGTPTTDPLPQSAGIQAIYDALEAADADGTEEIFFDQPIEITGATIIATGHGPNNSIRRIWLQDADNAIYFYRRAGNASTNPEEGVPVQTYVGQQVSFKVLSVDFYGGSAQIRQYEDWEVISDDRTNPVPYVDVHGPLNVEDHYYRNVRIGGRIFERADPSCGPDHIRCWDLVWGADEQHAVTFRVSQDFNVYDGECLTYLGPASGFPGPYSSNPLEWQLDVTNFTWARVDFGSPFED